MGSSSDTKKLKRKYKDLIRKRDGGDGAPKLTGHEVARWDKKSQSVGKVQGIIEVVKVLKGKKDIHFQ